MQYAILAVLGTLTTVVLVACGPPKRTIGNKFEAAPIPIKNRNEAADVAASEARSEADAAIAKARMEARNVAARAQLYADQRQADALAALEKAIIDAGEK